MNHRADARKTGINAKLIVFQGNSHTRKATIKVFILSIHLFDCITGSNSDSSNISKQTLACSGYLSLLTHYIQSQSIGHQNFTFAMHLQNVSLCLLLPHPPSLQDHGIRNHEKVLCLCFPHRVGVVPTEEKVHQVLKLTTDIQWLKIHGGSWKKNIKRGTSRINDMIAGLTKEILHCF